MVCIKLCCREVAKEDAHIQRQQGVWHKVLQSVESLPPDATGILTPHSDFGGVWKLLLNAKYTLSFTLAHSRLSFTRSPTH